MAVEQQQALKVKTINPSNINKAIACLATVLACHSACAELVSGENPDKLYIRTYAQARSQSAQSQEGAISKAQLDALSEFVDYALRENLQLPDSLMRLSDKIKKSLLVKGSKGNIKGAIVLEAGIQQDGRASCLTEIPKTNLAQFKGLDVRDNPASILNHLDGDKVLKMEIALELGLNTDLGAIKPESPLARAIKGEAIQSVSPLWLSKVPIDESTMPHLNDTEMMFLLEGAIAIPKLQELLLAEFNKRGYSKLAQYIANYNLPCTETLPKCQSFLTSLPAACLENEALLSILAQYQCALDFKASNIPNPAYEEALKGFSSQTPNFAGIKALLFKSFLVGVSDQSINLLGRCYEEEDKYNEAIVCYFQAYSINPKNEYVGWNLANTFNKLGQKEEALYWAQSVILDPASNTWAAEMAAKLINDLAEEKRIEEQKQKDALQAAEVAKPSEPDAKESDEKPQPPEPQVLEYCPATYLEQEDY